MKHILIIFTFVLSLISQSLFAQHPELIMPTGHNFNEINHVISSSFVNPKGTLLFTFGRRDSKCIVWDISSSKKLRQFKSDGTIPIMNGSAIALVNFSLARQESKITVLRTDDLTILNEYQIDFNDLLENEKYKSEYGLNNFFIRYFNDTIYRRNILTNEQQKIHVGQFEKMESYENPPYFDVIYQNNSKLIIGTTDNIMQLDIVTGIVEEIIPLPNDEFQSEYTDRNYFLDTSSMELIIEYIVNRSDFEESKRLMMLDIEDNEVFMSDIIQCISFQNITIHGIFNGEVFLSSHGEILRWKVNQSAVKRSKIWQAKNGSYILSQKLAEGNVNDDCLKIDYVEDEFVLLDDHLFIYHLNDCSDNVLLEVEVNDTLCKTIGKYSRSEYSSNQIWYSTIVRNNQDEFSNYNSELWNLETLHDEKKSNFARLTKNGFRFIEDPFLIELISYSESVRFVNDSIFLLSGSYDSYERMPFKGNLSSLSPVGLNIIYLVDMNQGSISKFNILGETTNFGTAGQLSLGLETNREIIKTQLPLNNAFNVVIGKDEISNKHRDFDLKAFSDLNNEVFFLKNNLGQISNSYIEQYGDISHDDDSVYIVGRKRKYINNTVDKDPSFDRDYLISYDGLFLYQGDAIYGFEADRMYPIVTSMDELKRNSIIEEYFDLSFDEPETAAWLIPYEKCYSSFNPFCSDTANNITYCVRESYLGNKFQFDLINLNTNEIFKSYFIDLDDIRNNFIQNNESVVELNLNPLFRYTVDFKLNRFILYTEKYEDCKVILSYDLLNPSQKPIRRAYPIDKLKSANDGFIYLKVSEKKIGLDLDTVSFVKLNTKSLKEEFKFNLSPGENFFDYYIDNKYDQIVLYTTISGLIILDVETGELKKRIEYGLARNKSVNIPRRKLIFTEDFIITDGSDESTQIRDRETGELLYSFVEFYNLQDMEFEGRVFFDKHGRFDGSEELRNKLYFVCGLEVVELNQVKDSLYVPHLVQRIMNGENLDRLPKLSDLNICGVTPVVEPLEDNGKSKRYRITPRSGGVGDVEIYLNGVVRKKTNAEELRQEGDQFILELSAILLEKYQIPGEEMKIKVIAKTANNAISSRGLDYEINFGEKNPDIDVKPSLHAIVIGIDDYKDPKLDLNYAAKDANDLHTTLEKSAKKFFNIDDTNRVFFYNLTINRNGENGTKSIRGITPDKGNILQTLEMIEKTSKPEDVFLVFFAGHGELVESDQLMLLSSESTIARREGIKFSELLEKFNKIPAGKRILILDACHSGAAINNLDLAQLVSKRNTDDAERHSKRIKELDKLSSKSGIAIITASSSDQKALELPEYEHGLMTYALLNAMLNNKNTVDEQNILQIEKWFMATEEEVENLNKEQSAERFVPINFSLGIIDDEVRNSIVLKEIPTVYVANVLNMNNGDDNFGIKEKLSATFTEMSRGAEKSILVKDSPNASKVNVLYEEKDKDIIARISIKTQNDAQKFELSGNRADLDTFIQEIAESIRSRIEK